MSVGVTRRVQFYEGEHVGLPTGGVVATFNKGSASVCTCMCARDAS